MIVGHLDAVGGKGLADLFVHAVIDRPVVGGGDPEPDEVGDAARAVFAEDDRGRGLVRHLREGGDGLQDRGADGLGRRVVGGGVGQVDTAAAEGIVVDDLGGDDLAVGHEDLLIIHGGEGGVGEVDGADGALDTVAGDVVANGEGLGDEQHDAAGNVGERILQRERHGETGNAQQGDERGDLHTDRAENGEREENVEHGAQRRAQIGAEGRETLGAVKRAVAQAQDDADEQHTERQQQKDGRGEVERLVQRGDAEIKKLHKGYLLGMIRKFAAEAMGMITAFLRRRNTRVPEKSEGKGCKNAVKKFTSASFPAKRKGECSEERRKQFANTTKMAKKFWLLFFDFLCFFH